MTQRMGRIGSSFEDYLAEQGTLGSTNAVKRVLAWQLEQAMERRRIQECHGSSDAHESEPTGPDSRPR